MRRPVLALAALSATLAACEPQARRLLVLDLGGGGPARVGPLAAPWRDAGYDVDHRRFFPHLVRADLARYRVVIVLGGDALAVPSERLTAGDLAVLDEWLDRGGVVVVGYPPAPGGVQNRWLMNRWLASIGAGITIAPAPLTDAAGRGTGAVVPRPWVAPVRDGALFWADAVLVPGGTSHALNVTDPAQVLARAAPAGGHPAEGPPVVAARRVGDGLVVVASRSFLGALGPDDPPESVPLAALGDFRLTRGFLAAIARWTRRPAEWAAVPPAGRGAPLSLAGAPLPVPVTPPPLEAPVELPAGAPPARPRATLPPWLGRGTARVLWAAMPGTTLPYAARSRTLDSLLQLIDAGGIDVVAGPAGLEAMAESTRYFAWERTVTQATWRMIADRVGQTSVRWIPSVDPSAFRLPPDSTATGACVLSPDFWDGALAPAVRVAARLAADNRDLVPAVGVDLDAGGGVRADAWCDADYRAALDGLVAGGVVTRRRADTLAAVAPAERHDTLAAAGLLPPFLAALRHAAAARTARLRLETRRGAPELGLLLRSRDALDDWFALGLLDGWSEGGGSAALLTEDVRTPDFIRAYLSDAPPAVAVPLFRADRVPPAAWPRLERVYGRNGFWVTALAPDSLARELRRFAR